MANENTKSLIPCPFCGGEDLNMEGWQGSQYVVCFTCLTAGPSGKTEEEAAELWNRRAENGKEE